MIFKNVDVYSSAIHNHLAIEPQLSGLAAWWVTGDTIAVITFSDSEKAADLYPGMEHQQSYHSDGRQMVGMP